jgi:hypothetical protein
MNERAEQNADVLGKLTVLGTIVLPMNIITGMVILFPRPAPISPRTEQGKKPVYTK